MSATRDRGEYRPLYVALVDGPQYQQLSAESRFVLLVLKLRCDAAGIKVIPGLRAALLEWTALTAAEIDRALEQLVETGWVKLEHSLVWVVRGLEFEPSMSVANPKHRTFIRKLCDALPSLDLVNEFRVHYAEWFVGASRAPTESDPDPVSGDRSDTLSHTLSDRVSIGYPTPNRITSTSTTTRTNNSPPAPAHAHTHALYEDPLVIAFFDAVPIEKHPTWRALVDRWLEGESWGAGPKPSPEEIAAGLAAAIVHKSPGQLGDRFVRSCIRTAMRGEIVHERHASAVPSPIPPELLERAKELTHLVRHNALARGSGDQRRDILRDLVKFGDIADAAATEQALGYIAPLEDLVRTGRSFDDALRLAIARLREQVDAGRPLPPSVRPRPTFELVS